MQCDGPTLHAFPQMREESKNGMKGFFGLGHFLDASHPL